MFFVRWIPTFLAFPLAGWLAMLLIGPNVSLLTVVGVGAIVGAIVGGAQWLALGRLVDWRWGVGTLVAVPAGGVVAMLVVGSPVTSSAALVTGLITGLLVGAAQSVALGRRLGVAAIWTATVGLSWAAAWLITSLVIVDLDRGHAVFGSSGALVATIVTGVVLRMILKPRARRSPRDPGKAPVMNVASSVVDAATSATRTGE